MMTDEPRSAASWEPSVRAALRLLAVTIAMLAAIDPAITTARTRRPMVAVVPLSPIDDRAMAADVAEALRRRLRVIDGPLQTADATVLVGRGRPHRSRPALAAATSPTYAVSPDTTAARVVFTQADAPSRATVHERVPVRIVLRVREARGSSVRLTLRAAGVVVDSTSIVVSSVDTTVLTELAFVPADTALVPLRIEGSLNSSNGQMPLAAADLAIDVKAATHTVLVFDPRPTWSSTFVRRALERDPRFAVTSRIVTSRNLSTATGAPPLRLDDASALSLFDAIVVGAPDALSASDVRGLETFLRQRGGSVVLLLDQRATSAVEQLSGIGGWQFRSEATGIPLGVGNAHGAASTPAGSPATAARTSEPPREPRRSALTAWRATQIAWPSSLPAAATVLSTTIETTSDRSASASGAQNSTRRSLPVVWQTTVGRGQLLIGGAIDAWRFRDITTSVFDPFWQNAVASAASAALPSVDVSLPRNVIAPGELLDFTVAVRSAARSVSDPTSPISTEAAVSALLDVAEGKTTQRIGIRLWPTGTPGWFRGTIRAPELSGTAHLVVTAGDARASLPIIVDSSRTSPAADDGTLLAAWVAAHGGRVVQASDVDAFGRELARTLRAAPRREQWHPMRSPWWLVPFALALSLEWWLRRRRGLA